MSLPDYKNIVFLYRCIILYLAASAPSIYGRLVQIKQGVLNGTTGTAHNGLIFNSYYGIPFAQPPIGNLRFQPPQKATPWIGIWNASKVPEICPQNHKITNAVLGSEDCLYLNIYSPKNSQPGDNIPIIFFIHGGRFQTGSNMEDGPEYIMSLGNIILVQPNYRIGIFGFLSTGDKIIPGNMGLKDQTMALKWTKQNIYAFGGDPNRITLAGHSSGGVSASLHTLSPLSNGLFERAIIMSLSAYSSYAVTTQTVVKSIARELAQVAGCSYNSSEEIKECFLKMDMEAILETRKKLAVGDVSLYSPVHPVTEDKKVRNAFLPEYGFKRGYVSTSVPWLIGHTSSEGGQDVAEFLGSTDSARLRLFNEHYTEMASFSFSFLWNSKLAYQKYLAQVIKTHYLGNEDFSPDTDHEWTKMKSDLTYNFPIMKAIKSYNGTRYVYLYDYKANFSTQFYKFDYEKYLGVGHVDDLQLLFKRNESADSLSPEDISFGQEILRRWVNFAYSGNPNEPYPINESVFSSWKPVTSDRIEYLRMNLNGKMETDLDKDSYTFLRSIPLNTHDSLQPPTY